MKKRLGRMMIVVAGLGVGLGLYVAMPSLSALGLIVRVAKHDGVLARLASLTAKPVEREPVRTIPTRHGPMEAQLYKPPGVARRTTLLVPGVHRDGVREERLVGLAHELAATGLRVLAVGPPDLMRYRLSPSSTDQLEDAIAWAAAQPDLAPDGRVDIMAFSFSGGLAVVAAGRESVRQHVAAVLSFGGHADLSHVLRYLCDGNSAPIPPDAAQLAVGGGHIHIPKAHDYGAVVALLNLAPRMVPGEQVAGLQEAITTFLRASSIDRLDQAAALSVFAQARRLGQALSEPSRDLMGYVSDRDVARLGRAIAPILSTVELPAELSPARSPLPTAPVFLLHGAGDSVVPATEMLDLARLLKGQTEVHAFASQLITHAETAKATALTEMWRLAGFWGDLLRR
jgi:pimeloyl-ACP methyl ester carboxylesterase